MLRASIEAHEQQVDLHAIMNGGNAGEIEFQRELSDFAEAVVVNDVEELSKARSALISVAGSDVMVDAAGVASNFQRMVRIADSTGIELGDETMLSATAELRDELGINAFHGEKQI